MKHLYLLAALFFAVFIIFLGGPAQAQVAQDTTKTHDIYLFHSKTCPHCKAEIEFLENIKQNYPQVDFNLYEISNRNNLELFIKTGETLGADISGVPFLLIGETVIVGFSPEYTSSEILSALDEFVSKDEVDLVEPLLKESQPEQELEPRTGENPETVKELNKQDTQSKQDKPTKNFNVPLMGSVDLNSMSLPVLTIVVGFLDGFNPCAMWVLLFLISVLLGMKDRKRMWILGGAFILTSGFVYFLFMAAWLNFFLFIGYSAFVRTLVALLAIFIGGFYLYKAYQNRGGGCDVVEDEKRNKIFEKIKSSTHKTSLLLGVLGMMSVAFAVNLIELMCSAGLPALYTGILSAAELSQVQYYLYLALYILIFMLDDLVVFAIAMFTLKTVGVESKYTNLTRIIGGILILSLGILMIIKPEALTLNF